MAGQDLVQLWKNLYFVEPDKLQLLWVVAALFLLGVIVWIFKLYHQSARTYGSKYPFLGTMKFWFALIAVLFLCVVVYAQPFLAKSSVVIRRGSAQIIFVVDYSASMFLKDTGQARIDVAGREIMKAVLDGIIKEGDRAAIFIFGKIVSPRIFLTRDLNGFASEVDKIGRPDTLLFNDLYWGSSIGTTLQKVYQSLDRQDMIAEFHKESKDWQPRSRQDRLVVVLSDGDFFNYGDDEEAKAKMQLEVKILSKTLGEFKKRGLSVYSVGIGTRFGARLTDILKDYKNGFEYDPELGEELKGQISRLNISNLNYLAAATGGKVFALENSNNNASEFIKSALDRHRSMLIEPIVEQKRQELWLPILLMALATFLMGTVITKF
ncbi:MAG: VWA domain-containing protein [Candidatus Yanofskybacteria bacterium]|nr:VWA domain-containing protein [Candidatus Yanofskybacteria bacterium]